MSATFGTWQVAKAPLNLDLLDRVSLDPYLIWAALISFEGYGGGTDDNVLPFLIEWSFEFQTQEAPLEANASTGDDKSRLMSICSPTYYKSRFHTVMLPINTLPLLIWLLQTGVVVRFQLGAARGVPSVRNAVPFQAFGATATPLKTIGIVDDGCCLAHESFRSPKNASRFLFVWDQSPRAIFSEVTPWARYGMTRNSPPRYGAELITSSIEDLLNRHPCLGEENERALYKALDRGSWGDPGRIHGALVLHALGGPRAMPLPASEPISQDADTLPIIFVQLPAETATDTSGGSIGFYVLDGVRYITRRTAELSKLSPNNWSTTINISLGSIGGPHDGSTMVERALDEVVEKHGQDQVRIVMAAGNIAGRKLHAKREVSRSAPGVFYVMVQPDNRLESFVELWPEPSSNSPADGQHLLVSIKAPDGSLLCRAKLGEIHTLVRDNVVIASLIRPCKAAQGERGTMVLLAIRPTAVHSLSNRNDAPYGVWEIGFETTAAETTVIHAWVERNDTTIGFRGSQKTMFVRDTPPDFAGYVSDDSTLSSMANGSRTDCAGAFEVDRMLVTGYSANGPVLGRANTTRPTLYGASDQSASLPGLVGPGFFSGTYARLSGTSSGAPRVARWHAEGDAPGQTVLLSPATSSNYSTPSGKPEGIKPPPEVRRS